MIHRNISKKIEDAIKDTPVIFLAGARQTGKSTLAQYLIKAGYFAHYVTLDDYTALSAARNDPQGFINGLGQRVIIDEVQRAPELFLAIKAVVDARRKPGQFLLTGSANVLFLPKVADSLAGRMEIVQLRPFSMGELRKEKEKFIDTLFSDRKFPGDPEKEISQEEFSDLILQGGYPEIKSRATTERRDAWFGSYVATLLQRDIRELANIDGSAILPNLLNLLAARSATLLNFADISRSIQVPQSSIKRYIALFESLFLLTRIIPWSGNLSTRLTKAPKLYLNDTGLLSYLMGVDSRRLENNPALKGQIFETFIVNEILKQISWSKTPPRIFHFRTTPGTEVDILLETSRGECVGIEIKSSSSVSAKDASGLKYLQDTLREKFIRGVILYMGKDIVPFNPRIHAMPISSMIW